MTLEGLLYQLQLQWKRLVGIGVAIIAFLILLYLFASFSLVYVAVTGSTSTHIVVYVSSERATTKLGGAGLVLVPRSTTSLIVAAGDAVKTETTLAIPWYGYVNKKVTLTSDKNADKAAYYSLDTNPCATYSSNYDRLLSFKCNQPTSLQTYNTPPSDGWGNTTVANTSYPAVVAPYMGGVIGVTYIPNSDTTAPDITFTTESGQSIGYNAPEGIDMDTIRKATIYTDTYDITNNRFVLVDVSGNIYLGSPSESGTVGYQKIPPPNDYTPLYDQALCAISGDAVYCYYGQSDAGDQTASSQVKPIQDTIVSLSFTKQGSHAAAINTPLVLGDLYVTPSGQLFGREHKQLIHFTQVNDRYSTTSVSQNIDGATGGQAIYYIQNNGVYQVDSDAKNTYQVFYSKNVIPTSVYSVAGKVFVLGKVRGNTQTTYAYLLNTSDDTTPGQRLIDKFPLSFTDLTDASITDLVGDKFYVELKVTIRKNAPSADQAIDKSEVATKKQNVINLLQSLGVDINENNTTFMYR
jgi:hypothetical protein